ncbi:TPA: SIR2 family protein [Photobacterium damselae]
MNLNIGTKEALLSAIEYSDNDIVYLIGSPLSCSYGDTVGIPSVKGMLDIIESTLAEKPKVLDSYHKALALYKADTDKYQQSFSFLAQYTSPNTVNGIIRKATLHAFQEDTTALNVNHVTELETLQNSLNSWSIPPATEALAKILLNSKKAAKTVLTPNFDPLLSIALSKLGHIPTRTVLHGDSNIEQFQSSTVNIVHFHGYWLDTDTLHTPAQLTLDRPLLKQSLMRVLNNKTLVVLGYGGWDDVFTQVLFSLIGDSGANFDIMWAFFESNEQMIQSKYPHLINSVMPAIQRGRFRAYGGINCHEFLPEVANELYSVSPEVVTKDIDIERQDSAEKFEDEEIELKCWRIYPEEAHKHVRSTERSYLIKQLNENKLINIAADWGISHNEFIHTLTTDTESPYFGCPIYRIDLSNVNSKECLLERIEQEMQVNMPVFIQKLPSQKHILYFDNLGADFVRESEFNNLIINFKKILSIIFDYNENSKVILVSKKPLGYDFPSMTISMLEDYDAKSFILNHSNLTEPLDQHAIDTLIDIAQGIPSSLERCIKELHLLSTDELYEVHYTPESRSYTENDNFPVEIVNRVEMLSSSQELHSQKSNQLLKTLAVLEFGDTFTNLRKTCPDFNYRPTNFEELYDLELVEAIKITRNIVEVTKNTGDSKLLKLPTAVRNYVYSKMSLNEVYEIAKNVANVHLGQDWRQGIVHLCNLTKQQIKENDKVAGSTQILLVQLLKGAIELDISRDIEASFRACCAYCKQISKVGRHKEVISFSKQIKAIAKESDKIESLALFNLLEGSSARMLSDFTLAEQLLLTALDDPTHLSKDNKTSAHVNLMFLYNDGINNVEKAIESAYQVLEIEPKNSDALLTLEELAEVDDIGKLKALEQKFRNNGKIVTANNACFKLCNLETSYQRKVYWLNRVLASEKNEAYNKMRAITQKATLDENIDYTPTLEEIRLLHTCYVFSFSQRMTSLFNKAHKILWRYYANRMDIVTLFNLYRHSSIYWRVYDDREREVEYSKFLSYTVERMLPESLDISSYENAYVIHRMRLVIT